MYALMKRCVAHPVPGWCFVMQKRMADSGLLWCRMISPDGNDSLAYSGTPKIWKDSRSCALIGRLSCSPMPGKIVAIHVKQGETGAKGAPPLVMEAMKMEHTISAPSAGVIEELLFDVGDQVTDGTQLLTLKPH